MVKQSTVINAPHSQTLYPACTPIIVSSSSFLLSITPPYCSWVMNYSSQFRPKMSFYSFAFICSWCLNFLFLFKVSSRTCLANMHRRIYFLVCVLLILQDCIVRSRSFLSLSSQIRNFFFLDEYVRHQWNNKE